MHEEKNGEFSQKENDDEIHSRLQGATRDNPAINRDYYWLIEHAGAGREGRECARTSYSVSGAVDGMMGKKSSTRPDVHESHPKQRQVNER